MPDQNQLDPFLTAKAEAEAPRQEATCTAQEGLQPSLPLGEGTARRRVRARISRMGRAEEQSKCERL